VDHACRFRRADALKLKRTLIRAAATTFTNSFYEVRALLQISIFIERTNRALRALMILYAFSRFYVVRVAGIIENSLASFIYI